MGVPGLDLRTGKLDVALRALPHRVGEHGTEVVGARGEHHAMRLQFKRETVQF